MKISTKFDSGNIEVVSINSNGLIKLNIRKDTKSDFLQWFHFRLTGVINQAVTIEILNAGQSTYPDGWENYNICASYDRIEWFRIPTTYVDGVLKVDFEPTQNSLYFAYFAPYSYDRHQNLVHSAELSDLCKVEVIGETVEGRDIDLLVIGEEGIGKSVWVVARQHPGESMAEWFIEGLVDRLLDSNDPVSKKLLEDVCFYIIPNMNIDGSIAGNLRANAAGMNLNREWASPSIQNSPEVYHCLAKMDKTGVDLLLDIHGDEAIPFNFVAASEGIPSYNLELKQLEEQFKNNWMAVSPDFQDEHNYGADKPGEANLTVCSNAVAERFNCLSFTIEMPFKDNDDLPDTIYGWSPERSMVFGESILNPILHVLPEL
ncbi:M14 family metallopeptidase [Crocinitomix catalasitica]|uniref:M14 family metallopeptidase n=1 Tax=Crocinitomix catalasitica TaxID=184607 RepID=UPI00048257E2|nr:M14-type cytosolic carboxypeptidase [Crocinitomix catalasitica]